MTELSDFKSGTCMAGASVTKTVELFNVARSTVSKIIIERRKNLFTEAKFWKKAKAV